MCENQIAAERALGIAVAQELRKRLADIDAALTATDLLVGTSHDAVEKNGTKLKIRLKEGFVLVLVINHNTIPKTTMGNFDWSKVTRVKVDEIEESNDF